MKKVLLSALAICAFGFANAQDKGSDSSMRFGVKAGLNMTNFGGDADTDGATGFYVGGLVDFTIGENFHLQPELLYSMEGAKTDDVDLGVSYIRIPVMFKYYVMEGLNLQAGPEIAFKAGADDEIDEGIKSMDYGIGVGAAYELTNGLMFDLRYNLGLANISEDDSIDITNTGFQIGLGYRF